MKGEVIMFNFNQTKANAMNKVASKSTLLTFALTTIGVVATAYLASKEIPKAKAEVKAILEREDLTKTQKATESVKVVARSTWKTAVVGIGTILLVTGTSAITAANTATTVAGLTSAVNLAEQKLKDTNEAINELPQKAQEEVKRNIGQKVINRATNNIDDEYFLPNERCPHMYVWTDAWTGVTFKATMDMVDNAAKITDARFGTESYQTINDFYNELIEQGAIFMDEKMPQLIDEFAWQYTMDFDKDVYTNDNGWTIHTIHYATPSRDF
jgi:hypothetical protein